MDSLQPTGSQNKQGNSSYSRHLEKTTTRSSVTNPAAKKNCQQHGSGVQLIAASFQEDCTLTNTVPTRWSSSSGHLTTDWTEYCFDLVTKSSGSLCRIQLTELRDGRERNQPVWLLLTSCAAPLLRNEQELQGGLQSPIGLKPVHESPDPYWDRDLQNEVVYLGLTPLYLDNSGEYRSAEDTSNLDYFEPVSSRPSPGASKIYFPAEIGRCLLRRTTGRLTRSSPPMSRFKVELIKWGLSGSVDRDIPGWAAVAQWIELYQSSDIDEHLYNKELALAKHAPLTIPHQYPCVIFTFYGVVPFVARGFPVNPDRSLQFKAIFRTWTSCRTVPLVDGFSRGSPVPPRPCITVLPHFHLASPSSTLKTSLAKAAQISPLHFTHSKATRSPNNIPLHLCVKRCNPSRRTRVRFSAGSLPDSRTWESRRTMPLAGGFSRHFSFSPAVTFRRRYILTSMINMIDPDAMCDDARGACNIAR
ncbi:hypothetical protein PR048_014630 [Dryococelus australis]|uniref:Uncharacterized protein n=1 Tax=Dryococelus australis TaxID=614101 RepID=A0ABQ9HF66_9NEOP|nr:hypothetical protein PR048_014630 [Dryococelus australis]